MKIAIFVDMQKDFIYGPLGTFEAQAIVPYVKEQCQSNTYDMKIFTQDWHEKVNHHNYIEMDRVPFHCIAGTKGAGIIDLFPTGNWRILHKSTFGLYQLPDILMDEAYGYGEDITEIHVMGVCTDICVISNALLLRSVFPTVPIYVHANGCAGTTPAAHEAALMIMRHCLIDVI